MSDPIRKRIEALLRLAGDAGANENEAASAMAKAAALMAKHGIEVSLEDQEAIKRGDFVNVDLDLKWHRVISQAVAYLYPVKPILWTNYVNGREVIGWKWVGRPDVIDVAAITMDWLCRQVERLYKECLPKGMTKSDRAEYRRTFKIACAERVFTRAYYLRCALNEDDKVAMEATGQNALVLKDHFEQENAKIKAEMDKMDLSSKKARPTKVGIGTRWGQAAGDLVKLRDDLGETNAGALRLEHKS